MIFGDTPLDHAEGAILAHSLSAGASRFKKGRVLSAADIAALRDTGMSSIVAARLEPGDVHEDAAATVLAEAVCGAQLKASAAFTGRANLIAQARGLLLVDRARLDALNQVDESITVATLPPFEPVAPRQMAATIKIIPFAVAGAALKKCMQAARHGDGPLLRVAAFQPRRVGLVQTSLPGGKDSLLEKTKTALDARLAALDCPPAEERRCAHDTSAVAGAIRALREDGCEIVLISGASAIVDRRDVVPAGIVAAGGVVEHFGMPVDPGNLLLLGRTGETPVIGLPGCARSPKLNGFDWVLQRLIADVPVHPGDVMGMGAGGLLKEISVRPLPRAAAVESPPPPEVAQAPRIAALILAAGQSRRMGAENKLLATVDGKPMVAHVVSQVMAAGLDPVLVVTGHQRKPVQAALAGLPLTFVHNPEYAAGLSTSLRRGLAALPEDADGVMVCLGDMPRVSAAVLARLAAAFDPLEGRAICVPTWQGKRGNPVLLARRFVPEMQEIAGDVGARALLGDYPELVCEVAMDETSSGDGVLLDVDTPAALAALRARV
ncbi:MAG TPA: molybdopterin-binding/glycosyltransferase family 2 protein [Kiloniellales bacterium]|jgi:molybdenum cofactor cytidylyltransferase